MSAIGSGPRNFGHSQVKRMTPELAPPLRTSTPMRGFAPSPQHDFGGTRFKFIFCLITPANVLSDIRRLAVQYKADVALTSEINKDSIVRVQVLWFVRKEFFVESALNEVFRPSPVLSALARITGMTADGSLYRVASGSWAESGRPKTRPRNNLKLHVYVVVVTNATCLTKSDQGPRNSSRLRSGRGSLVVKITDSWSACHELEPSTAKDPPCRGATHVKSVEGQTSSRWCGVEVRRESAGSGVIFVT
ncbi:hypothetical protein TNCV_2110801 [Trichonephila clavipes]|nr:hypothetical protein TNCV_2110801 [Trichonephila clavipes]